MDNKDAKKSLKWIVAGLVAILAIVAVVWLVIRNNNNGNGNGSGNNASEVTEETKVSASELAADKVTDKVAFGDYDAMFTLSKDIQNGKKVGAIVQVDGVVSHKLSSYSIVQDNPNKEKENEMSQVGTVFVIQDGEAADYPKDGDKAQITAKVMEISPLNFQLVTLKDFVETK